MLLPTKVGINDLGLLPIVSLFRHMRKLTARALVQFANLGTPGSLS